MTEHKQVAQLYRPRWRGRLAAAAHTMGLSVLLAGGVVWTIQQKTHYTRPGALLALPGAVISAVKPSEDPFRISQVLRRYTRPDEADKIAKAVVSEGRRRKIDPAMIVGIMLVESEMNPRAKSFVGARGLMQVMPFHRGRWGCESKDLYDIEGNICHGVSVLADNIKRAPTLRVALQRYNGCVRGTNTPRCGTYTNKVMNATNRTARQIMAVNDVMEQ